MRSRHTAGCMTAMTGKGREKLATNLPLQVQDVYFDAVLLSLKRHLTKDVQGIADIIVVSGVASYGALQGHAPLDIQQFHF